MYVIGWGGDFGETYVWGGVEGWVALLGRVERKIVFGGEWRVREL